MVSFLSASQARIEVAAPPSTVFAVLSDPTTYPDWLVGAQRIRAVDPAFPRPGSDFQHSVGPTEAATVDDSTTATGVDPGHRLDLHVRAGIFHADVELLVVPSRTGSAIRFLERPAGPWRLLTPLLRPFLHLRNAESLRRLRRYVEQPQEA